MAQITAKQGARCFGWRKWILWCEVFIWCQLNYSSFLREVISCWLKPCMTFVTAASLRNPDPWPGSNSRRGP